MLLKTLIVNQQNIYNLFDNNLHVYTSYMTFTNLFDVVYF